MNYRRSQTAHPALSLVDLYQLPSPHLETAVMVSLSVAFTVNPPAESCPPAALVPSATKTYALNTATPAEHLQSLEAALGQARDALNEDLTQWKVAVGAFEVVPKGKKGKGADDDGEEDDGEGE